MAKAPEVEQKTRATFTYTGNDQTFRAAGTEFIRHKVTVVDGAENIAELRALPDFYEHNAPPK